VGRPESVAIDGADEESFGQLTNMLASKFCGIDILINGAGETWPGAWIRPDQTFLDLDFKMLWRKVVDPQIS